MDEDITSMNQKQFLIWNIKKVITDPNAIMLVLINILNLIFYFYYNWKLSTLIFLMFIQSIIVLIFYTFSYLFVKDFPKDGLIIQSKSEKTSKIYSKSDLFNRGLFGIFIFFIVYLILTLMFIVFLGPIDFKSSIIFIPMYLIGQFFSTKNELKKSFIEYYQISGLNLAHSIFLPIYIGCFTIFLMIPYLGIFIFVGIKTYGDILLYNLKNNPKKVFNDKDYLFLDKNP